MSTAAASPRVRLTGVCPPARGAVVADYVRAQPAPVWLVVTEDVRAADQLAEDIVFFDNSAGGKSPLEVLVFPESLPDSRDLREAFAASSDRLNVLSRLRGRRVETKAPSPSLIVVTTPTALLQAVPALEKFAANELTLRAGQAHSFRGLLEQLQKLDYDSEPVCEAPGQYAIRGGIIDVYPVTATQPYRLDFFGDVIESIRAFDPVTQRSTGEAETIAVAPSPRVILDLAKTGISDYLTSRARLLLIEPAALAEEFGALGREDSQGLSPLLTLCSAVVGVSLLDEANPFLDDTAPEVAFDTEALLAKVEALGRLNPKRPQRRPQAIAQRAQVDQLLDFSELVDGDYVVHLQHGIAFFRGLSKLDTAQGAKEVISLEFDDSVTLHVPLSESHLVSRYVGLSKTKPQLGRIGSGRWEKARQAAERSTLDLAAELLQIHAKREAQAGHAFQTDTDWQKEFESSFPFVETPDQLRAIRETKADMERTRPMDRLICGDVGFGKTEVALRAAFKAVQGARQVAVLVPTTVLAQQHLNTFRERMANFPVTVEMMSRFRSPPEQKKILAGTANGQIDILIGTHRLLQKDVKFKDLGLVVIDEEQRFGVKHKEVFKRMRETVDVLSMSATPIPRTLYLALTGARDLSVIETAPTNRHPIQTIVKTYDEKVVVDAIRHEIRRGGQVFYLHNRVATIGLVASRLHQLMPDLAIGIGHGKMESDELERVMTDFVAGKHQLLVCTTIIESGLDIPNCNTIIIEGADRFGLAQLYQLRGRVGRFKHQAYAYLLLHRNTRLLDVARQRLSALRTHNQLGAGFRIAMRDLELRGAGNLLGAEQSGHIVGVGFELYCQLLRQSVARLKGDKSAAAIRASVKLDFVYVGEGVPDDISGRGRHEDAYTAIKDAEDNAPSLPSIQARIPTEYIGETRLRIDVYRRLALASSVAVLRQIEDELRDRFGDFGNDVRALFLVTEIRIRAEQKALLSVETESNRLKCLRNSSRRDDWVMLGTRFPRLTAPQPLLRLREIISFLNNLPNPP